MTHVVVTQERKKKPTSRVKGGTAEGKQKKATRDKESRIVGILLGRDTLVAERKESVSKTRDTTIKTAVNL